MVDYSIDSSFDIHLTDRNNIAEVDGKEEFEQDLVIEIQEQFSEAINGYSGSENIKEKVQLLTNRVASESGVINSIERLIIREPVAQPETIFVEIGYSTGETFTETI